MSRTTQLLLGLALAFAVLELGTGLIEPYGLLHDELYYWVCSKHLGLGYVDHPPLSPWVLAASVGLLGDGLLGFGVVPALCGAATLLLTGLMARRLGAQRYGQLLAGLCVAVAPFSLVIFSFYSVNALELLFWTVVWFLMVELIRTGDERLWLGIGLVAGIALLNKHTFVLLLAGLAVGVLATPLRTHLRSRWLWLGGMVALLLASPNLYWNLEHGWPSLAFYSSRAGMNLPTTIGEALILQIVGTNPASVFVWAAGLLFLLFSRAARPYRPLGAAFLTLFIAMLFSDLRRGDRIAGAYPLVLAAGAAFWDQWRGRWSTGIRWTLPALLLVVGLLVLPIALPVLPPQRIADFFEFIGESPEMEQLDTGHDLPIHLMARLEWERFAEDVIRAWESLPLVDRERSVVLAPHWLYASVVEYYGRDRDLPPVVSPHNAYYFWRQDAVGRDVVLSVLVEPEVLALHFAETRRLGIFCCEHCASWRPDIPIHVSYGPAKSLEDLLADWRYFGLEPSPQLADWHYFEPEPSPQHRP